jgi:epoxyqueuosine reductase
MDTHKNKDILRQVAQDHGVSAFGVCEIGDLVDRFHPEIRARARSLPFAVSIGIDVPSAVMDTLTIGPNEIYKSTYQAVNTHLDNAAFYLAQAVTRLGRNAIAIPASKVVKRYPMIGHVSHREVAQKAGLGWRGKNNLLINPIFGSRLRLATVLIDLDMEPDAVNETGCGNCTMCGEHCPVGAIGGSPEEFSFETCRDRVIRYSRENNFGQLICGLCLNHCPESTPGGAAHD